MCLASYLAQKSSYAYYYYYCYKMYLWSYALFPALLISSGTCLLKSILYSLGQLELGGSLEVFEPPPSLFYFSLISHNEAQKMESTSS